MMQTLDIERPGMPDLQFTLLITALCTSHLTSLNIPEIVCRRVFDRCWVLLHESPPPRRPEARVLDLRPWTQVTLDALVVTIRAVLAEAGIRTVTWEHYSPSTATQPSTASAMPLIERFGQLYPQPFVPAGMEPVELPLQDPKTSELERLLEGMAATFQTFTKALERSASDLSLPRAEHGQKKRARPGMDMMRRSGAIYMSWARYYAGLSLSRPDGYEEMPETHPDK